MSDHLKALGASTPIPTTLDPLVLERIPFSSFSDYPIVRFTCPEFTSLCPKTGAPDFATIVIDYMPNKWLVESKALKLYLGSFRNHGMFHELCADQIVKDLALLLEPDWLRVAAFFYPRGGIPIDVLASYGDGDTFSPKALPLDPMHYRGR